MCHNLIIILHLEMKDPNHLPTNDLQRRTIDVVELIITNSRRLVSI